MTTTTTQDQAQGTQEASNVTSLAPVRATWKQHGNPLKGWLFFGSQVKAPNPKGIKVMKVEVDQQGITLVTSAGRKIDGGAFGTATKFWAIVPADATKQEPTPSTSSREPKPVSLTSKAGTKAEANLAAALTGEGAHKPAPEGYALRWPKPAYDLLKAVAKVEGQAPWLVRCNAHGTTTSAQDTRQADSLGTVANRPNWCPQCKADAAAKVKAEAKAKADAAKAKAKAAEAKAQAEQAPAEPQAPAEEPQAQAEAQAPAEAPAEPQAQA
jgi:hypothetical protein